MPRQVLIVTAALCLFSGSMGLWLGLSGSGMSESDVIEAAAARWTAETGNTDFTSCVAWPHREGSVWLEVSCGIGDGQKSYRFDRKGELVPDRPET